MPGPRMGPRPADFDEDVVKNSPTYLKWCHMENGQKLRYACRDFIKGHGEDDERLMRRIMIARRNNLRDHETLKKARASARPEDSSEGSKASKKRRVVTGIPDAQIAKEMDVAAVEQTRSYQTWIVLEDGKDFVYNQKYTKGKPGHDWLLRKNIWRRMRYRRENKKMVEKLKGRSDAEISAAAVVDHALLASAAAAAATTGEKDHHVAIDPNDEIEPAEEFVSKAVVEAAVAAAESYVKEQEQESISSLAAMAVHNPLASTNEALDAAAKLAAASSTGAGDAVTILVPNEDHVTATTGHSREEQEAYASEAPGSSVGESATVARLPI